MPRTSCIITTGYPYRITRRGNNRAMVSFVHKHRQACQNLLRGRVPGFKANAYRAKQ